MSGATILICDDSESTRLLITAMLRSEGYEFVEAASATEAVEQIARVHPDLVILDLNMPGGGGRAIIEAIRGDAALAATRTLLVSGATEALDPGWAESVGADAHLPKPFRPDELRSNVAALLGR